MKKEISVFKKKKAWNRPAFIDEPCETCGKIIEHDDEVTIIEERDSIFRGDDEVHVVHKNCYSKFRSDNKNLWENQN